MIKNQKGIFLYALIATFFVFNLGIFMGYMLEVSRVDKINLLYLNAEIGILDQLVQKEALGILNPSCDLLNEENIKFGDNIYREALTIQEYENANKINNDIQFQHKRFDLLRTLFFVNSIRIKQKCNSDYHIVTYLYKYNNPSLEQDSKQKFFSNLLGELKEKFGNKIILIPIATDNDIPSVNLIVDTYKIIELPTILIDENIKLTEVKKMEEIEKYLN
ncbi:MAG: hypothetical protein AABW47_03110 [Nanoarchaeota archaeon]